MGQLLVAMIIARLIGKYVDAASASTLTHCSEQQRRSERDDDLF
jgi:hypothetical protein